MPGDCWGLDGHNGPDSTQTRLNWLWVFDSSGDKVFPPLILDGVALPHTGPMYNLEVILDLLLLLEEKVVVVARKAFVQLQFVHQLRSFLD